MTSPAAPPTPAQDADTELARFIGHARLAYFTPTHDHPSLADRKASFILGTAGLLTTVLLFFIKAITLLSNDYRFYVAIPFETGLILLAGLLLLAARWAYKGYVFPIPPMPTSLAYFRNIAAQPHAHYVETMCGLDHQTAIRAVLDYNYSVACQAVGKFRFVNKALRCMKYAIPLWMLLLLVIAIMGK